MAASELVCTDLRSVELAVELGADRVELCAALEVGGVTPGAGLLQEAVHLTANALELVVLIRPRAGDFVVRSGAERNAILRDIAFAREAGAGGVAVGALDRDGEVDVALMRLAIAEAGSLRVTFHRAVDSAVDLERSLDVLVQLGVPRVLTSGGAATAWDGRFALRRVVDRLGAEIEVIAASGVTGENADAILRETGAGALHGSCKAREAGATSGAMGWSAPMDRDSAWGLVRAAGSHR